MRGGTISGSGKLTARDQGEAESTHSGASEEDDSKQSSCYYSSKPVYKLHVQGSQQAAYDRSQAAGEPEHSNNNHQAKSMRHNGGRSNSAIRLEAGRLQVNVSHRSEKQRENLIAVQS